MGYANRALHRRPRTEQAVLAIIRGERRPLRSADQNEAFDRLRALAASLGLVIQDGNAAYLGDDEFLLLSWLASAQRPSSDYPAPDDEALAATLSRCAAMLNDAGMHLYPMTLYHQHLSR